MPKADDAETDSFQQYREAYLAAALGVRAPELAFVSGKVVNAVLGTTEYDPSATYRITRDGIVLVVS